MVYVSKLRDRRWLASCVAKSVPVKKIAQRAKCSEESAHRAIELLRDNPAAFDHDYRNNPVPQLRDREWLMGHITKGTPVRAIAKILGCSGTAIQKSIKTMGLPRPKQFRQPRHLAIDDSEWLGKTLKTNTAEQTAKIAGCSVGMVRYRVKCFDLRVPYKSNPMSYIKNHRRAILRGRATIRQLVNEDGKLPSTTWLCRNGFQWLYRLLNLYPEEFQR